MNLSLSPSASQRIGRIPELLSLIFSFLDHSQVGLQDDEHEDLDVAAFPAYCACSCDQCCPEDDLLESGLGYPSFPSPFYVPLAQKDKQQKRLGNERERKNILECHCNFPAHQPLANLFNPKPFNRFRGSTGPNKPSYNLANALVCRLWNPIALDVLWRVVDHPERLFALLDGAWGSKLLADNQGLRGLHTTGQGPGRMPKSWKPGVKAFLGLVDDDTSDDEDDEDDEDEEDDLDPEDQDHGVRRRQYRLFSFRAPPTPESWSRFDRYARRVRHLVYTRPCLMEDALHDIAVTRPRLAILPRMHTLTWADNPLNHAVVFMHEGVRRLDLRIEVFGCSKVDPDKPDDLGLNAYTYDDRQFMSLLYGIGEVREDGVELPLRPDRMISMTLATQLAEIPRRMPNLETLCLSSFIPVSLYLPALLCTLFRIPPTLGDGDEEELGDVPVSLLRNLRRLTIPRFYHCAPLLEHLTHLPSLESIDYQYIYGYGWGRPSDVGLDKCVPKGWMSFQRDMEESRMAEEERRAKQVAAMAQFASRPTVEASDGGSVYIAQVTRDEDLPTQAEDSLEVLEDEGGDAEEYRQDLQPTRSPMVKPPMSVAQRTLDASNCPATTPQLPATSSTLPASLPLSDTAVPSTIIFPSPSRPRKPLDPVATLIFRKLTELSVLVPLSDARKLLLSSPPSADPDPNAVKDPLTISTFLPASPSQGFPGWPQNLVYLHINTPPGILTRPREIRALFEAIAYACYGPSTGRDTRPARLERLEVLCCADADSGYEAMCETFGSVTGEGEEMCLSLKTLEPILGLLCNDDEDFARSSCSVPHRAGTQPARVLRPKFALKTFEISHQFPMYLTQSDVETIAQRWGGCIEVLILCCEPMAAYGMTKIAGFNDDYQVPTGKITSSNAPEATLTLGALLPFAKYCTELRHLALFVDATKGVKGLMRPLTDPNYITFFGSDVQFSTSDNSDKWDDTDFDFHTSEIGRKYLEVASPRAPGLPLRYPIFRKLLRLNMGCSPISVNINDLDFKFTDGDDSGRRGQNLEDRTCAVSGTLGRDRFTNALKDSARARIREKVKRLKERGVKADLSQAARSDEHLEHSQPSRDSDEDDFLAYLRANGVRLGLAEEDLIEVKLQEEMGIEGISRRLYDQGMSTVAMFLAQIMPCFPSRHHPDSQRVRMTNSAFTAIVESGTTWSAPPPALMSSSRAIQASYTLGQPYEVERRKETRRRLREEQERQANIAAATDSAGNPTTPPLPPPVTAATVTSAHDTLNARASSVVIPFFPVAPSFTEPFGYFPSLFSSVIEARTNRWNSLNEASLPSMVAMREEGWTWGGRVGVELKTRLDEIGQPAKEKAISDSSAKHDEAPDGCVIS